MRADEIKIEKGVNVYQNAGFELNDKMIDYESSQNLSFSDVVSITNGLNLISEFYDVKAAVASTPVGISGVSLGKTLIEAVTNVMDCNPIDFMSSTIILSDEVDSDIAKMLKDTNKIVATGFTKNAIEYLENHNICYVQIKTSLKDYRQCLSNQVIQTPLGTITQTPNLSELDKDSFRVVTKLKPSVEQVEDAVFAWKVAKHIKSQAIVIAKDLKTTAIAQGLLTASVEFAIDYSCERSKDAILATDIGLTIHDVNVAAQGRIGLIIVPFADKNIIDAADKYNIGIITTGFTNILI